MICIFFSRYSIMLSYSFAMGYPLGSYLEYPFLVLQGILVVHFSDAKHQVILYYTFKS